MRRIIIFYFNIIFGFIIIAGILAPVFMKLEMFFPAWVLYSLFSNVCHQDPRSSFFIYGHKVAYCARCSGVYAGLFLGGIAGSIFKPRRFPVSAFVAMLLPLAIDRVMIELGFYNGFRLIKFLSGLLCGMAISLLVFSRVKP